MSDSNALRTAKRFCVYLVGLALLDCAGSKPAGQAPSGVATAAMNQSPGARCLEDAAAIPEPRPGMPLKIQVSQILVRHAELDDPRGATRTREQACLRALEALHALQAGAEWDETVKKYSDSPASDLGRVAKDDLAPGFAETAFTLDINQLSYVVESSRGFHVILRTQ